MCSLKSSLCRTAALVNLNASVLNWAALYLSYSFLFEDWYLQHVLEVFKGVLA